MKTIVRMLRSNRDLILNYFRARKIISSGIIEGLNNKAKVTMRKSYGFRTYRVTELAYTTHLVSCPNRNSPTNLLTRQFKEMFCNGLGNDAVCQFIMVITFIIIQASKVAKVRFRHRLN